MTIAAIHRPIARSRGILVAAAVAALLVTLAMLGLGLGLNVGNPGRPAVDAGGVG